MRSNQRTNFQITFFVMIDLTNYTIGYWITNYTNCLCDEKLDYIGSRQSILIHTILSFVFVWSLQVENRLLHTARRHPSIRLLGPRPGP